eukprot:gene12036-15138_t
MSELQASGDEVHTFDSMSFRQGAFLSLQCPPSSEAASAVTSGRHSFSLSETPHRHSLGKPRASFRNMQTGGHSSILSTMEEDGEEGPMSLEYGHRMEAMINFRAFMQGLGHQPGAYSLDEFIKGAARAIENIFPGVNHASFCLLKASMTAVNIYTVLGEGAQRPPRVNVAVAPGTLILHVLRSCQPIFISDIMTFPGPCSDVQFMRFVLGLKAVACVPLVVANSRILGFLRLGFAQSCIWEETDKAQGGLGPVDMLDQPGSSRRRSISSIDDEFGMDDSSSLRGASSIAGSYRRQDQNSSGYNTGNEFRSITPSPSMDTGTVCGYDTGNEFCQYNTIPLNGCGNSGYDTGNEFGQYNAIPLHGYGNNVATTLVMSSASTTPSPSMDTGTMCGYDTGNEFRQYNTIPLNGYGNSGYDTGHEFGQYNTIPHNGYGNSGYDTGNEFGQHNAIPHNGYGNSGYDTGNEFGQHNAIPHNGYGNSVYEAPRPVQMTPKPQTGPLTDIKMFEVIGRGGFGSVYKAFWHGQIVAVKVLEHGDEFMGGCSNSSNNSRQIDTSSRRAALLEGPRHGMRFMARCS